MPAYSIRRGPTLPANPRNGKVFVLTEGADQGLYVCVDDGVWTGPLGAGGAGGPATEIEESSGPTTLAIGAVADGEFLKREGSTVVGAAAGGASYLVYTALLSQAGTNPPTATVLENTLGAAVTFGYDSVGNYYVASDAFTQNKSVAFMFPNAAYNGIVGEVRGEFVYGEGGYPAKMFYFVTKLNDGNLTDDWIGALPLEIRVYP